MADNSYQYSLWLDVTTWLQVKRREDGDIQISLHTPHESTVVLTRRHAGWVAEALQDASEIIP